MPLSIRLSYLFISSKFSKKNKISNYSSNFNKL